MASGSFDGLVRLWDTSTGRHLLTLLALPASGEAFDWLALTPEGYANSSSSLASLGQWRMGGDSVAADTVWKVFGKPDAVARAVRGETVSAPSFSK